MIRKLKDQEMARPTKRSGRRLRRSRLVVLTAFGALLSSLAVTAAMPGVANAGAIVPCPTGITEWRLIWGRNPGSAAPVHAAPDGVYFPPYNLWEGYRYTLVSAVPQFLVSDAKALDNGLDVPVNYEITSTLAKSYKISATVGISTNNTKEFLQANVSSSIEASVTTTIGVKFSTTVPPHTRLTAEYGTDVYQVSYYIEAWRFRGPYGSPPPAAGMSGCEEWGYYPQNTQAPTLLESWRLRNG
jgi:hypothetical protein